MNPEPPNARPVNLGEPDRERTAVQVQVAERFCPQPTEACEAGKTGFLLLFASGGALFGGALGAASVAWLVTQQQKRGG